MQTYNVTHEIQNIEEPGDMAACVYIYLCMYKIILCVYTLQLIVTKSILKSLIIFLYLSS